MADTPRDLIILGFRQSFYTERAPRKPDGSPGDVIKEDAPDYWVKYCNRGMPNTETEERLRHMDPDKVKLPPGADGGDKMAFFRHRWAQIQPAFEAWVNGQQMPEYGIPLSAWPALNAEQVKVFQSAGIKSIEDVRDMSEGLRQRVRLPNITDLQKLAGLYLEGLSTTKAAEAAAAQEARIAGLEEQLAAAMALLEEQAAKNAETQGGKKPAKAA